MNIKNRIIDKRYDIFAVIFHKNMSFALKLKYLFDLWIFNMTEVTYTYSVNFFIPDQHT